MRLALTCFVGSFLGAFGGVVGARAIGAWVVRRTFERMKASAAGAVTRGRGAVPAAADDVEGDCA